MTIFTTANPADTRETQRRAREILINVVLSLFFLQFAIRHATFAAETFRLSTVLLLLKISTDVVFYLIRRIPKGVSVSLYDWVIAIAGTYFIMFFQPVAGGADLWAGQAMQLSGMALQVLAMLSLNRSIGMVAANRGIQTSGLYRFVRHPLYLSYVVAFLGYVINQFSIFNLFVYVVAVTLWVLRLRAEEKFLMQSDDYRSYAEQVRWRILPGVF